MGMDEASEKNNTVKHLSLSLANKQWRTAGTN